MVNETYLASYIIGRIRDQIQKLPPRMEGLDLNAIGLSTCRSIVDDHGGRLWADANQPRGAVFSFTLHAYH